MGIRICRLYRKEIKKRGRGNIKQMNIELELIITVIVAMIGSNALWGFLQFLLERKDKKKDCSKKILEAIQKINDKIDQRTAIGCRIRILKFMDEIIEGWEHSKDSYNQLMQDITHYHQYCEEHPQFLNHQTDATIERLKKDYEQRLATNDFEPNNK